MPYYNNIPQGSDFKDESQPLMLANFAALTSFGNGYCDLPVVGSQPPTLPLTYIHFHVLKLLFLNYMFMHKIMVLLQYRLLHEKYL